MARAELTGYTLKRICRGNLPNRTPYMSGYTPNFEEKARGSETQRGQTQPTSEGKVHFFPVFHTLIPFAYKIYLFAYM